MNAIQPGTPVESSAEIPAQLPPIPGAPPLPPQLSWVEKQKASLDASVKAREAEVARAAVPPEEAARVEALRAEHGALESGATSFARGALDAILAPGALVGAAAETVGNLYQVKQLEDFGRGLGSSATGKSAMEALSFVLGGGGEEGATRADAATRVLREQQEARPTLTTLSRLAGVAATGLGIGATASGHASLAAGGALNVLEGAASGAQVAYDESAPLRDVLTSAAIGAAIGGAATGIAPAISYAAKRAPDMSKVFGKVQKKADELMVKSTLKADKQVLNQLADDPERMRRVAARLRDIGGDESNIIPAIDARRAEAVASEIALARGFGEGTEALGAMTKIDDLIGSYKRSSVGEVKAIGDQLERQVAPLKAKLVSEVADDTFTTAGGMPIMRTAQRAPTFEELASFRRELAPSAKLGKGVTDPVGDAHRSLFRTVSGELEEAAKARGPSIAKAWNETSQAADDFDIIGLALERDAAKRLSAPLISGGEVQSTLAGALLAGVTAANPLAAAGGALTGAILHRGINKLGGAVVSKLTNRFAKMGARVSLRAAGGREMKEVMEALANTKRFTSELAEAAGDSPGARQEAEELAMGIATRELEKRAGPFSPETWHQKPLTPLQKVFYRGPILDKVAEDMATVAQKTQALHPGLPQALDPARIAKFTRDADGPAAVGLIQSKVRELASIVPPTPTGEMAAVALRRAAQQLDTADAATAMARGHELAAFLDDSAANALDEPTQGFVRNAANALRNELGGDAFGEAGRHYRALLADTGLGNMADPKAIREGLRGLEGHGTLPAAIRTAQDKIAGAYNAAVALAGVLRPKGLAKEFEAGQHLFHAAEEALTIDGKAMHQVIETSQHVGIHEAAHPHAEAHEMTVADAVDGELDNLTPVLRDAATGGSPRVYRPGMVGAAQPRTPPTIEEEREQYGERLKTLTQAQTAMSGAEDGQHPLIASEANDKMAALLRDMPKPPSGPLGTQGADSLSADDLRLANAMWEATVEPLSVISDLASGYVDPDKSSYAWKQYPGAQRACQAGIIDSLSNDLTQEERDMLPENLLTQLDATFGFGGKLQETSDPFFASRMSEVYKRPQDKRPPPAPNGVLKLPGAEPSFTERIASG